MSFDDLNLSDALRRALADLGHDQPTPIQESAIPPALEGRDLIASASTGTGKTAAFLLPALTRLEAQRPTPRGAARVLVLAPTRELAAQLAAQARNYAKYLRLMQGLVTGGAPYPAQRRILGQRIDLLVATPGRLIDHLDQGAVDLSRVELLVLDEADRMLDMGFMPAVRRIAGACPADRQTLLFTATWDGAMAKVGAELLRDPVRVAVTAKAEAPARIEQQAYLADDTSHKERLLSALLKTHQGGQGVIFVATRRRADRLAATLYDAGLSAAALHGEMTQGIRTQTLSALRNRRLDWLVATDLAARGIDVAGLGLVVNFDLPRVPEDYVHRIGRTGRAGSAGVAAALVGPDDVALLRPIERYLGQPLPRAVIPGLEPVRATDAVPGRPRRPHPGRRPNGFAKPRRPRSAATA